MVDGQRKILSNSMRVIINKKGEKLIERNIRVCKDIIRDRVE